MGDAFDRLQGIPEERERLGHPHVADLVLDRVADQTREARLGGPTRAGHLCGHVAHADSIGRVQADILDGRRHLRVVLLHHGGGLALDDADDAERPRLAFRVRVAQLQVKEFPAHEPRMLEVGIHAGERRLRVFADLVVVVDAENGEVLRNPDALQRAGVEQLLRGSVERGEDPAWLRKRLDPRAKGGEATCAGLPLAVEHVAAPPVEEDRVAERLFTGLRPEQRQREADERVVPEVEGQQLLGGNLGGGGKVRVHGELDLLPERGVAVEIDGGDVAKDVRTVFVHVAAAFGDAAHGVPEVEDLLDVDVAVVAFHNNDLDVGAGKVPLHAGDALAAGVPCGGCEEDDCFHDAAIISENRGESKHDLRIFHAKNNAILTQRQGVKC